MSEGLQFAGSLQTIELDKLIAIRPAHVFQVVGEGVETMLIEHLGKFDRDNPNKMGGKRTHFIAEMAKSVTLSSDDSHAEIVIHHIGINQKIFGGEIKPTQGKKYLTIPAIAEAYGTTARDWPNLVPLFSRKGGRVHAYALAEAASTPVPTVGKGKNRRYKPTGQKYKSGGKFSGMAPSENTGRKVFMLVESVNQQPTDGIIPTDYDVKTNIMNTISGLMGSLPGTTPDIDIL